MVSGMKQGQMEKPLLELLDQQQLEMEGQLKELPQEELQEQADDVSEQHVGAEEVSGGQVSEYPQCCLEDLNGDGCRKLAGESLDECTEEQQSWLKLPARLHHLVKVKRRGKEESFVDTVERWQPEHLQERRRPQHVLERRQPEHVLERWQPEHVLERRQPEHVLERRQPEHLQERRQPEHVLERRQPKHVLERRQPEHVLERRQPEHLQERRQPEHLQERRQPEHLQERRQPEHLLERRQPISMCWRGGSLSICSLQGRRQPGPVLEWRQPEYLLKEMQLQQPSQQLFQERWVERVEQKQHLGILWELRRKQPREHPEMEGLECSGIDPKHLDLSEVLIVADNGQQYEELPTQWQITTHEEFRSAMQGLLDMFVKLRILLIVVETPEWSYGVWLLVRNKPKDWLHVLRLINNDVQDCNKCKLRIDH